MADNNGYRSWASFVDSDDVGLRSAWKKAVVQLAAIQHGESERASEIAPDYDDPSSVFDEAASGKLLPWWPPKLERLTIKIRVTPNGQTTESLSPVHLDPNNKDLGTRVFDSTVVSLLESQGGDFDGRVQIQILRASDRQIIGGHSGDVFIGTKMKKKGGSSRDDRDDFLDELRKRDERQMNMIDRMFGNSAHVLGASAAVVQATRGVNMAPPWMNGEEGGMTPLWMGLLNGAMQVGGALLSGGDPKQQIRKIMTEPVHPMLGHNQGQPQDGAQQRPALPDHGGEGPEYGSDQFLENGQYDGFRVVDSDMLEEGYEEYEEEYEEEDDWDEEEDEDEEEYEEEEEEEEERPKKKKGGDPFAGKSVEEVGAMLEKWVDENNSGANRGKIQSVGMRLAGKIMK